MRAVLCCKCILLTQSWECNSPNSGSHWYWRTPACTHPHRGAHVLTCKCACTHQNSECVKWRMSRWYWSKPQESTVNLNLEGKILWSWVYMNAIYCHKRTLTSIFFFFNFRILETIMSKALYFIFRKDSTGLLLGKNRNNSSKQAVHRAANSDAISERQKLSPSYWPS